MSHIILIILLLMRPLVPAKGFSRAAGVAPKLYPARTCPLSMSSATPEAAVRSLPSPILSNQGLALFWRDFGEFRREDAKHFVVVSQDSNGEVQDYAVLAQRVEDEDGNKVSSWWAADFDLVALRSSGAQLDETGSVVLGSEEGRGGKETKALLFAVLELLLSSGCRPHQFRLRAEGSAEQEALRQMGFSASGTGDPKYLTVDPGAMMDAIKAVLSTESEEDGLLRASASNVRGRLLHAAGDPGAAVGSYTEALQLLGHANATINANADNGINLRALDQRAALVWLNMGGAYAAQEESSVNLAAGAWQRSIELSPEGFALPYFKLGQLYLSQEGIQGRKKKHEGAGENAIRCFRYFCTTDDGPNNTDALTALGNAYVHLLDPENAIEAYLKALEVDDTLWNVHLNLAQAYVQLQDFNKAVDALENAVKYGGEANVPQAVHMLAALKGKTEQERDAPSRASQEYLLRLFDDAYAGSFDGLMRKRIYAAPRIMRSVVRDVFNSTEFSELPPGVKEMNNNSVLPWITGSLRVLDLGCGTGLTAAWLRDYSGTLVGVDVSPSMLRKATAREVFDEVVNADVEEYLKAYDGPDFDVVSASLLSLYLGGLEDVVEGAARVLRPGGLLVFTVDTIADGSGSHGYVLTEEGTYAHEVEYVKKVIGSAGLELREEETREFSSRLERGEPRPGHIFAARVPSSR